MNSYKINRPSSLDRRIACIASGTVEQEFPDEDSSVVAEKGIKLHDCLETGETPDSLEPDEVWNLETARKQIDKLIADLQEKTGQEVHVHKELKVEIFVGFDKFTNGTADLVLVSGDVVVIIDYKSGRIEVNKASYQLQAYALGVLQSLNMSTGEVFVGICQPICFKEIQMKKFDAIEAEMSFTNLQTRQQIEPYNFSAGDHCKYCKFRTQCPASNNEKKELVKIANEITAKNAPIFIEKHSLIKGILADAYSKVKELVDQGLVEGYEMKEYAGSKKCNDINGVFNEWKEYFTPAEFMEFCELKKTVFIDKAKRRLKDIEDIKTLKDSELRVKKSIDPFMKTGKSSKRIVKKSIK